MLESASATFQLEVSTLAGECLAAIPEAQGSWQLGDVLDRLPEVQPGHRYQLLKGEAVLAPGTAIADWAQPADGKACVTAVVAPRPAQEEQAQLDQALIQAARELNVEKVRELLISGADATFRQGGLTCMTALHAAVDANGGRGEDEAGITKAVLGALLSARADVDAEQELLNTRGGSISKCALLDAVQQGSPWLVRLLLDARANVDAVYTRIGRPYGLERETTSLHLATQAGHVPVAALLLERGANVNAVGQYRDQEQDTDEPPMVRRTALHVAVAGGNQSLVALLVQAGADASLPQSHDDKETSLEELCAGKTGMQEALGADTSAALLGGGDYGAEVEAALAAFAARRAAGA